MNRLNFEMRFLQKFFLGMTKNHWKAHFILLPLNLLFHKSPTMSLFVSFAPFSFLRFHAPFSFSLRFHRKSASPLTGTHPPTKSINVSVESWIVYLILFQSFNILIQLFPNFRSGSSVIRFSISKESSVKLKVRRIVNQKFLWGDCFLITFFNHFFPKLL